MRLIIFIIVLVPGILTAQQAIITGNVRGGEHEPLPLAHVVVMPDSIANVTDENGEFKVKVSHGRKELYISYTGYATQRISLFIKNDTTLNFKLDAETSRLEEVVITSTRDRFTSLMESTSLSKNSLRGDEVEAIPVLGGEADPIKVLQLLPGTLRGIEGSSDLFVRGGAADQNLVLLDGATVYNTSHLLGFVSVFNTDILESVESVNGGFPADVGGRLSSILDVKTKSEIAEHPAVSGDLGLIASRLFLEAPILNDKLGVWVAGRRTYVDRVAKAVGEEVPYFFYDLNARLMFNPSKRDKVSFIYYSGQDDLNLFRDRNNDGRGFLTTYQAGNNSQALEWTHENSSQWQSSLTLLRTSYKYDILNSFEDNRVLAFSDIEDVGAKFAMIVKLPGVINRIKFGVDWTRHDVSPSVVNSSGTISEIVESSSSVARASDEVAPFALFEWSKGNLWSFNTGIRTSLTFVPGKTYVYPEPRISARYKLDDRQALKFSYSRMIQSIHRVSNSAITSPTDVWYPVTDSVGPQTSHQVSIAWHRTFPQEKLFMSVEGYYKDMRNLIGFQEGTNLFFNPDFESKIVQGTGRAFGLELLIRKLSGKLTGWLSYTLARSTRQFDDINKGRSFPARYDRRHNGAIVAQYELHSRWYVSGVWEFISGAKFTPVVGKYVIASPTSTGVDILPVFAPTNSVKLSDTHRLDLGIKFKSRPGRRFQYEWFAGVYNVYNRSNPVGITIEANEDGSLHYEQPGIFGFLPFISYKFRIL